MDNNEVELALEAGRKNKRTWELVRNWCSHVKMTKHGGVGLLEMQSGLPIGHHFLECEHAPAGGMAAFDLAETALNFYDRNCAECKFRQPVGLPNISILVAERDARVMERNEANAKAEQEVADCLAARETERARIRKSLAILPAETLDQISQLDRTRDERDGLKVVELAQLAPETFEPVIIEHLFALLEAKEYWLAEPCIKALSALGVDAKRLCDAALQALGSYHARKAAAEIVKTHAPLADVALIPPALSSLIVLASPLPGPFGFGDRERIKDTGPLEALYRAHPLAVKDAIKTLLDETDAYDVQIAVRGIETLAAIDPSIRRDLMPELVAKVVRAKHLVKGDQQSVDDALNIIRDVVQQTYLEQPQETEVLFGKYLEGASQEGAVQLLKVYQHVLHDLRFERAGLTVAISEAHRLSFRRLVIEATKSANDDSIEGPTSFFAGDAYDLAPLIGENVELLLGSAAVLDTKLSELDAKKASTDWLQHMADRNRLQDLCYCFIRWSCTSAGAAGPGAIGKVLDFLRVLPETSSNLRATIIESFDRLMTSTDAVAICLPEYYTALVCSDPRIRSIAATVLGELRHPMRENLPSLVFEAFAALLTDPYVNVHQAAVRALRRFRLPEAMGAVAHRGLANIITVYAKQNDDAEFLMTAIEEYASRYLTEEQRSGKVGTTLIGIAMRAEPYNAARRARHWGSLFGNNPSYPDLLLRLLADRKAMSVYHEALFDRLEELPAIFFSSQRAPILAFAKTLSARSHLHEIGALIERLSAAGARSEASELARTVFEAIEDTTQNKTIKLHYKLRMLACSFEDQLSTGRLDVVEALRKEWDGTIQEIAADREANKRRGDPFRGLHRPN